MAILHINIELRNSAGAVWFFAAAGTITFSHCIKSDKFKTYIEAIQYSYIYGNEVVLSNLCINAGDFIRFERLAEEIEASDWFAVNAYRAVRDKYQPA